MPRCVLLTRNPPPQDPGGFAESKVWNDFVATLQEFRQEHGLPVSLVVVGHVPVHGDMRLRLRYVKACQTTWMKVFWQELGNKSKTPLPVSSIDRLTQVVHNYRLEHQSMTRLCEDLLTNVTVFFAHPSRFIWNGLELHPSFLAWFHVHGTAKRWLSTAPGSTKYTALAKCQRLQNQLQWWWNWQTKLLPFVLSPNDDQEFLGYLQPLAELFSSLTDTVAISCLPPLLERYLDRTGKRKMDETTSESNSFSLQQQQARTLLYELIILLGHANKETNEAHDGRTMLTVQDKTEGIRRMIHDLFEFVIQSMDAVICDWDQCNPLAKTLSKKSGQSDGEVTLSGHHHRHDLVGGLISPSKELFGLLQDRLSISREEWFYQFGGSAQDFVRGLWTLVILGLVQAKWKRLGTGNTVYYEKVSVVWC